LDFYSRPEIHPNQIRFSSKSLTSQIFYLTELNDNTKNLQSNCFSSLGDINDSKADNMEEDDPGTTNDILFSKHSSSTSWHSDTAVKALSEDLFSHL
jgi:hypothetical protein